MMYEFETTDYIEGLAKRVHSLNVKLNTLGENDERGTCLWERNHAYACLGKCLYQTLIIQGLNIHEH